MSEKCSKTIGGLGILVLETAKDVAAGKSMEEILDHLKFNTYHTQYLFTVDDIEYLHRGGRVNGIEKVLGSLLQIKPVLHVITCFPCRQFPTDTL